MAVRHERGRDAVGQSALFADFLHQPAAKPAAAEDFVDHQRGVPVRIVALQPGLAERHRALRHGAALDEQRAAVGRGRLGQTGSPSPCGRPPKMRSISAASSAGVMSPTAPMTSVSRRNWRDAKAARSARVIAATLVVLPDVFLP